MLLIDTDKLETHIHTQARVTEGETKERRTTNNRLVRGDDFDDGSLFSLSVECTKQITENIAKQIKAP